MKQEIKELPQIHTADQEFDVIQAGSHNGTKSHNGNKSLLYVPVFVSHCHANMQLKFCFWKLQIFVNNLWLMLMLPENKYTFRAIGTH